MSPRSRSPLEWLASTWHKLLGRVCFRLGSVDRARRHFERVLELKGDDYVSYLYLGRLAYSVGDYAGWRRELGHARRTAPGRFERAKYPFDLFEPLAAGTLQEETGERATWRAIRVSSVSPAVEARGLGAEVEGSRDFDQEMEALDLCSEDTRLYGDDFSSTEERERFVSMSPIERGEIAEADLDKLLQDLSR